METLQYVGHVDRSEWGIGPWDGEPDKMQWPDPATGLPCLAVRHPTMGHWCGYVGVSPGHPLHGKGGHQLEAHGGVNFADSCATEGNEAEKICHVPGPGEEHNVWWFGFDCAHGWDCSPGMQRLAERFGLLPRHGTYRTLGFIKAECYQLAQQLKAMA